MIPIWITSWIAPRLFKLAGAGAVVLIGMSACLVRDARLKETGRQEVVSASKAAGAEANVKSEQARKEAAKPGAARRLQSDRRTCVDC
jgi:hypothetical protein